MTIEENRPIMVFRKDLDGKPIYSLGMSRKNQDGTYTKYYPNCRFRNGVSIENMTKIKNVKGWVDGYQDKDNKSVVYFFINEYEIEETQPAAPVVEKQTSPEVSKLKSDLDLQYEEGDDELPF